jgi:quinol monooxygenase YgiN
MIFVAGTMTMNPEIIDDFKAEVAAMVDKVRAEDGCMHYSFLV